MKIARRGSAGGRVQGVGFRYHTQREATRLGLGGWVRNLPGGRVEFEVVGEEDEVEAFLAWLRQGPPFARVDELVVEERSLFDATSFEIRR